MQTHNDYVSMTFLFKLFNASTTKLVQFQKLIKRVSQIENKSAAGSGTCRFTCEQQNQYLDLQGFASVGTWTHGLHDPQVFPWVYLQVTHVDPHP